MSRHGKRRTGTAYVTQHAVVSGVIGSLRDTTGHLGTSSAKFFTNSSISPGSGSVPESEQEMTEAASTITHQFVRGFGCEILGVGTCTPDVGVKPP